MFDHKKVKMRKRLKGENKENVFVTIRELWSVIEYNLCLIDWKMEWDLLFVLFIILVGRLLC